MTTPDDGYLSRDRKRLAELQRRRRARMTRIDYMPGDEALAVIERVRLETWPHTNSAAIDAIVTAWAAMTGIKNREVEKPKSTAKEPELTHQYARGGMTSATASNCPPGTRTRKHSAPSIKPGQRVTCGATRHRDGKPCQAKSEPGKRRCRFHGGRSTGPRTEAGKARSLANLKQNRRPTG